MFAIFGVTLPYFALIGCGYAARWRGVMVEGSAKALNAFVLYFALPALMVRTIAAIPFEDVFNPGFFAAWGSVSVLMFVGTLIVSGLVMRQGGAAATVHAAATTHGNVGYLGITLVVSLAGEAAAAPVAMAIIFDMLFVVTLTIALLSRLSPGAGAEVPSLLATARSAILNPFVLAIGAGLLLSLSGAEIPKPVDDFMRILGMAAVPAALFAIGVTLYGQPMRAAASELGWICAAKLLIHPLVMIFVATTDVFGLTREEIVIAVLLASLPVANNVFILALRYETRPNRMSGAILFSTGAALATFNLWAWLLLSG
ncbi:MAG: AEC family transporter [Pikeienuella sp.]|uniref:AEC family transporter n=1 Tax=Pikeienuella sp. TaxID=2831957 RepID=UPI003918E9F5